MTNSKGSLVVVGGEGPQDWLAGVVVVPDGGGEGEESLEDAGDDASWGLTAVSFEVELALKRVVDGLDDLTERFEDPGACAGLFAFEGGPEQSDASFGEVGLELAAGVALVGDERLAGSRPQQIGIGVEQVAGDVAFVEFGVGQG